MSSTFKSVCKGLATAYSTLTKNVHGLMHEFYLEVGTAYLAVDGRKNRSSFKDTFVAAMDGYVTENKAGKILTASSTVARLVELGFIDGDKIGERPIGAEGALVAIWYGLNHQPDAMIEALKAKRGRADKSLWLTVDAANAIAKAFKDPNGTSGNKNGRSKTNAKGEVEVDIAKAVKAIAGTMGGITKASLASADNARALLAVRTEFEAMLSNGSQTVLLCEEMVAEDDALAVTE